MLPEASLFCDILCVRNWTLKLLSSIPRPIWWGGLMMFYGHEHAVKFKCIGFTSSSWTFFMLTWNRIQKRILCYVLSQVQRCNEQVQQLRAQFSQNTRSGVCCCGALIFMAFGALSEEDQATLRMVRGAERSSTWISWLSLATCCNMLGFIEFQLKVQSWQLPRCVVECIGLLKHSLYTGLYAWLCWRRREHEHL